jgi:hypothetical protein
VYKDVEHGTLKNAFLESLSFYFSKRGNYQQNLLKERLVIFFRDFQRGKVLNISLSSAVPENTCLSSKSQSNKCSLNEKTQLSYFSIGPTTEGGIALGNITVLDSELQNLDTIEARVVREQHSDQKSDRVAKVSLIPFHGISVISDIDDTIKITGVGNIPLLLENTFAKAFQPVNGKYFF